MREVGDIITPFFCFCCLLFVCFHSITFVPGSYFPFSWNMGRFPFRHWVSFPGYITKKERAGSPALTPNQLKPVSVSIHPDKGACYHTSVFLHQGMAGVSYCSYFHACGWKKTKPLLQSVTWHLQASIKMEGGDHWKGHPKCNINPSAFRENVSQLLDPSLFTKSN